MKKLFKIGRLSIALSLLVCMTMQAITVKILDLDTDAQKPREIGSYSIEVEGAKTLGELKKEVKSWNPGFTISGQVFFGDDKASRIVSDSTSLNGLQKVYVACPLFTHQVNVLLPNDKVIAIPIFHEDLISTVLSRIKDAVEFDYPAIGMKPDEVKDLSSGGSTLDPSSLAGAHNNTIFSSGMFAGCICLRLNGAKRQDRSEEIPAPSVNSYSDGRVHSLWKKIMKTVDSKESIKDQFLSFASLDLAAQELLNVKYLPLNHREIVVELSGRIVSNLEVLAQTIKRDSIKMESINTLFFQNILEPHSGRSLIVTRESIKRSLALLDVIDKYIFNGLTRQFSTKTDFKEVFASLIENGVVYADEAVANSADSMIRNQSKRILSEINACCKSLRERGVELPTELASMVQPSVANPSKGSTKSQHPPAPQPDKVVTGNDVPPLLNGGGAPAGDQVHHIDTNNTLELAAVVGALAVPLAIYLIYKYRTYKPVTPTTSQEARPAEVAVGYEQLTTQALQEAKKALTYLKAQRDGGFINEAEYKAGRWNILRKFAPEKHAFIESEARLA